MTLNENTPVYYLPVGQTVYQKALIDILIQLHRPHILSCLKKQDFINESDNTKIDKNPILTPSSSSSLKSSSLQDDGTMSIDSMIDAFIFNVKQITNHPTLLVDHYIPRNLLLLNSKENIINLSNKYHQISEILDKLVEKDVRKTIIISVSNAKEMDLIESFLLGKRGLQYYRFSGSSLYYDNHGSFDFHKDYKYDIINDIDDDKNSINNNSPTPSDGSSNNQADAPKKKNGRNFSKKYNNENNNNNNNGNNNNSHSNNNNNNNDSHYDSTSQKRKKGGRPSSAEKRAREQQAQVSAAIAAVTSNDSLKTDLKENKIRFNKEDYIPRLSKNNEEFRKMLEEKKSKNLNVYLILSSQLKYLLQFEDLKSDLIFSLDSNFTNFNGISNILNHRVPIIKPIILESLEHYEWEMNNNLNEIDLNIYNDNNNLNDIGKRNNLRRLKNNNNNNEDKEEDKMNTEKNKKLNKLLVLLSIASSNNIEIQLPSTIQPISNDIIEWLIEPSKRSALLSQNIKTKLPFKMDDLLINKVKDVLLSSFELSDVLNINKLDKYSYFNENNDIKYKNKDKEIIIKHESKRIKLSPDLNDKIPEVFTYREYQSNLTSLINDTLQEMVNWINKITTELKFVHLDETERQFIIDQGNFQCGELFKKDRDLGVKIEARGKINEKSKMEYEKFNKIVNFNEKDHEDESNNDNKNNIKSLKERFEFYSNIKNIEDEQINKQNEEIQMLKEKLNKLKISINEFEDNSNLIRQKYQEVSGNAAELSAFVKKLENDNKILEQESKGEFKKIQVNSIIEKRKYFESKILEINNDCNNWRGYLNILKIELDKRNNSNGTGLRVSRSSRNNTPH